MKLSKKVILLFVLMLLVLNSQANKNGKVISRREIFYSLNEYDDPIGFMNAFYKWYKTQYKYLYKIQLINMSMDTNKPYTMNYDSTERYLHVLKLSGFFSNNYINFYRNYFKKIGLKLIKTKQNDGPVDGLDSDFIMHSQEPESYLNDLSVIQLSVVKFTNDDAIVKVKFKNDPANSYQLIYLFKINGKYFIEIKS